MANTLGGVELPYSLIWLDYDQWASRLRAAETDVNGEPVIFQQDVSVGRPVTLTADRIMPNGALNALFNRTERDAIQALSDGDGPFTLVWLSVSYTVDFVSPPEWEPFYKRSCGMENEAFLGTLRLKTVA